MKILFKIYQDIVDRKGVGGSSFTAVGVWVLAETMRMAWGGQAQQKQAELSAYLQVFSGFFFEFFVLYLFFVFCLFLFLCCHLAA